MKIKVMMVSNADEGLMNESTAQLVSAEVEPGVFVNKYWVKRPHAVLIVDEDTGQVDTWVAGYGPPETIPCDKFETGPGRMMWEKAGLSQSKEEK